MDPSSLSVRTLKALLKANFVEQSHVIEKAELVKLVNRLIEQHKQSQSQDNTRDDTLCRICLDAEQNCVFLDCGHMVSCMDCAKKVRKKKRKKKREMKKERKKRLMSICVYACVCVYS